MARMVRLPGFFSSASTPKRRARKVGGNRREDDLGELQSAYDIMLATLREWGLQSLAPVIREMLVDGREPEQITVLLQDTEEYKKRFAGNELRRQKGIAVLSPGDYLATEAAYRRIMESAGLPQGFYDTPEDFAEWIGNDVAPTEIRDRVDSAMDTAFQMDQATADAFEEFYGITRQNIAAFFLDRDRGLRELERISRAGRLGGIAEAQDIDLGRSRAEQLAASELIAPEDYRSAVGTVARLSEDVGRLADIHGVDYGQRQAEEEVFFGSERARRRRRQLGAMEEAEFEAGAGGSPESLAQPVGQF